MSITLTSEQVSEELEEKIIKAVQVKKLDGSNKFGFGGFGKQKEIIVRPFKMDEVSNTVSIPFRWALDNIPNCQRPSRDTFSPIDTKFTTSLRSVQK